MYKYTPIQTENSVKKTKGILYCNHLPENGQIIGKVDLSDVTIDKNAEACLCVNETDYTVMPMETEDDTNKMKGFIPVSDKNSPDIYYLAIEKIHRLPLWICGLVPLAAVSIVALSVGIPAFLRPENKPQVESNPVIVADNDVTPTPIPTPARETIEPSATETRQAAQEDTTPEKKEDRIPDKGKDQIAVVPVADIKTPAPTEAPKVEEDTKKDDDTKTTSTPNPTVTPAPTTTPHVHTYVVEEQAATCTNLGFYKKYCSECGYVVADHTCTALGHTNSVASVSNMTYPDGMAATYVCDRCNETVKDNFDYTAGIYKADGSLLYTYDALEELFNWNLSTTPVKEQMDAHTELADGRILVLPNWEYLSKVAEESGETNAIYSKDGTMQSDGKYHLAFSNTVLTEVVLPDDTPYLGNWFIEANNIEKIELPDSITEYKGGIYSLKNLKYLKVSAGVPVINMHFTSCPKVETLIIPEGVTSIQGVNFPAFGGETANGMNVFLPNTLTSFGGCFNSSKIKYLYIPGSVTDLTDLNSITGLEEIVLGEGIEKIPIYFRTSGGLKKITIPSTMKEIGDGAFYGANLKEVIWGNCNVKLGSNVFEYCNDLKNLYIPDNTKEITSFLISGNSNMKTQSVVFPEEVDLFGRPSGPIIQIRNGNDSGIVGHVIMPSKINKFVTNSSSNIIWDTLEEIVLPGGDYSDIYGLFSGCNKLKEITFTSELTGMSKHFFTYIPSVTDIYYYGSEESINTLIDEYNAIKTDSDPANLFGNVTIHYMTGNPPTREELMKEYGIWDDYRAHMIDVSAEDNTEADTASLDMDAIFPVALNAKVEPAATEHTHSLSIDEKAPTCTENGYYRVTCSACGEVLADHVCKKLGHNMQMIDPEDNTADIMVPRFKCNRCDYTESTNHTHNWIAKGYENITYPNGGDAVYVCTTCLNKKKEHCDAVPGIYNEAGALMYTYNELEEQFNWNLSTTPAKDIMDAHTELGNGRILLLPSWQHLSEVAAESGADCGLIRGGNGINPCFAESILTEVILPNDCNDFGNWFCTSNVTKIELPDSITSYGRYSISSTPKLKYLKLSAGTTDLTGLSVQSNPALETLVIPEGVEKLGNTTFAGNDKLKNVTLPSTLTDIGYNAFASTGVKYLEIPAGVKEIGNSNHSLAGMSKLKTLVLNDGLEKIGNGAFQSLLALETINIPKSVTEMGNTILSGLQNLKNVTFEDGLTKIGNTLFVNSRIEKIIIPNSVKDIPENLFTGADSLKLIVLPEEVDCMGGGGLFSCGNNSDELKIIMPTSVKEWRAGAAFCSSKLKEIVIPGNIDYPVSMVGNGRGLEKVVITSEPNSIAYGAFGNLYNADIYYYGSKESVEKFNADAGDKDVFFLTDNNNRLHYMTGNPPTREDQMNGIDYNSLEEATIQSITSEVPAAAEGASLPAVVSLPVEEDTTDTNTSESTDDTPLKSVSDGDAK